MTFHKTFLLFKNHADLNRRAVRIRCAGTALVILLDIAASTLTPYCAKSIVDGLSASLFNSVWMGIVLLGFFWILEKTLSHIQEIIFFPVINTIIRNLHYKIVQHIHQISLGNYQKLSMPEVINCARRISQSARTFIKIIFLNIIPSACKLFLAILIVLKIGLFGLGLVPVTLIALVILYKGTQAYVAAREVAWQATDRVTIRINDSIINTHMVRAYPSFEMNIVGKLLDTEANLWQATNARLHKIYIFIGIFIGLSITAILASALWGIQEGSLSIGDFVLLKGLLISAFLPLKSFSTDFRQLAEALVDIKKVLAIFQIPVEPRIDPSEKYPEQELTARPQGILIHQLSFAHPNHPRLFENLSLHIPSGKKIALIGENGSGKSTVLHLIAGLYKPQEGKIHLGGQTLHCIPQDARLFNMSLRENLCHGLADVPDTEILKIAARMDLIDLIQNMPQGLDTIVGEMGIKLSGGEKQKVALTRALLSKPDILLLDESTSSLTLDSEKMILDVLFLNIPTVILASHRMSLLQYMDRVFKIENGKINEVRTRNVEFSL